MDEIVTTKGPLKQPIIIHPLPYILQTHTCCAIDGWYLGITGWFSIINWEFGCVSCPSASPGEIGPSRSDHVLPSLAWNVSSSTQALAVWLLTMAWLLSSFFLVVKTVQGVDIGLKDICGNKLVGSCPDKIALKVIGGESSCAEKVPWNVLIELTSGPQLQTAGCYYWGGIKIKKKKKPKKLWKIPN